MALAYPTDASLGEQLRAWRGRRRLSQMALAHAAGVSPRHLSFVETGRSHPSRELVLHLAEHLDVPLRDRNGLLLAAGFAPVYRHTPLDAPDMAAVRQAIDTVLTAHLPRPALVVDAHWNLIDANASLAFLIDGIAPALMEPPINVMRVSLHPDGLARTVENHDEFAAHMLGRLHRQVHASGDPELARLLDEVLQHAPGSRHAWQPDAPRSVVVPVRIRWRDQLLALFSTVAVFGAPADITTDELAIESFFPADEATAAILQSQP